ncbi:MAG: ABC transporter permease [Bacteroidetes bacterium SW_8_64_56]|jgi:glycerol transport system permease protein|nr:MAG: ABC transporter permease [Bacteroidetes bacterium QS_4_64_154]PSQ94244.1 MAG: ABC transporter permease [Bacteroidetes bacterium SW_7_64_58]PSR05203.1 MAG: ABC transporter permease [Bacteroidetes bacterium SW_8_64_56]
MKQRPWLFLLPALILVSISAFIPLITVMNYSQLTLLPGTQPYFSGLENFVAIIQDPAFQGALGRQILFSGLVLITEIPLGLALALCMPSDGPGAAVSLVLLGIPLLIPWNVVGIIWRVFTRSDIGVLPEVFSWFGYTTYNVSQFTGDAWWTVLAMDIWHWTPLVVLICYAGIQAIPEEYYMAAKIDRASPWKTFRYVTLPNIRGVLIIAVLLRLMDSFKIYAEPFVLTGGGPGSATTFMSTYASRMAIGGFQMGRGGATSLIYFFIVIFLSFVIYIIMLNLGQGAGGDQ